MKGSIDSIESLGLFDGPDIRVVVFMNGCSLRCLYCHNPEMWQKKEDNISVDELVEKIKRFKPYFKDNGGITFSGGEPLQQVEFLKEVCKKLKEENIHIALDTAGVSNSDYSELLDYIDLVILDIKHITKEGYQNLTNYTIDKSLKFIKDINDKNKDIWIRQVIVPSINDNIEYIESLYQFIKDFKNVKKIELLPFHYLGKEKYEKLSINYPLKNIPEMDKKKCDELYQYLLNLYKK